MIRHRCSEWAGDEQIHPYSDWLWGTCFQFYPNMPEGQRWALLDETSQTASIWTGTKCPFCALKMEDMK